MARSWDSAHSPVSAGGSTRLLAPSLRAQEQEEPGALQVWHRGNATQEFVVLLSNASQRSRDVCGMPQRRAQDCDALLEGGSSVPTFSAHLRPHRSDSSAPTFSDSCAPTDSFANT